MTALTAAYALSALVGVGIIISEYTVARHVQNMLQKLGCPSRIELAAFAVEHALARHFVWLEITTRHPAPIG